MMIARRLLTLRDAAGDVQVPIVVFQPERDRESWVCRYEIGWPDGAWSSAAWGFDSVQAIMLAFQKIGTEIYFSDYHGSGRLMWGETGRGYGFPVPANARDQLVGDDATFF